MKRTYTWKELLLVGGFEFEQVEGTDFSLSGYNSIRNEEFFEALIIETKNQGYSFFNTTPDIEAWMKILTLVGGKPSEEIYTSHEIRYNELDVYILGVIVQLRKIGFVTRYSCDGHDNKHPFIIFDNKDGAIKFSKLLKMLQFKSRIKGNNRVELLTKKEGLLDLAIKLNKYHQNIELLNLLLSVPGSSGNEGRIRSVISSLLTNLVDELEIDSYGNILAVKQYGLGKSILLSAHMDVVYSDINPNYEIIKENYVWRRNEGILGADDRAGVAMILNVLNDLENTTFDGTIKIALTVEEEIGQRGAENINSSFYRDVSYAISLDRKNSHDIVTNSKFYNYCDPSYGEFFEMKSSQLFGAQGFKVCTGGVSDLRVWSSVGIDSVNLSIGYYNEHTKDEYLNINEWMKTMELVMHCLPELATKVVN